LGIYRGVASFDQRAALLLKRSEKEKEEFIRKVEGIPEALGYDLHEDVRLRLEQGKRDIRAEARRAREPIDESASVAFKRMEQAEKAVEGWPPLAESLIKLSTLVVASAAECGSDRRVTDSQKEPASLRQARARLKGRAIMVDTFAQARSEVDEALIMLARWKQLNDQAQQLLRKMENLQKHADGLQKEGREKEDLRRVSESLREAWEDLWFVDLQDLEELAEKLSQVAKSVARLDPRLSPVPEPPGQVLEVLSRMSFNHPPPQAQASSGRAGGSLRSRFAGLTLMFRNLGLSLSGVVATDLLLILIALALASFFLLNQSYFGHAWGEPKDYITAFIAGYGSQGLVSILDAFSGRQLSSTLQSFLGKK
jgi:hypothetical protein